MIVPQPVSSLMFSATFQSSSCNDLAKVTTCSNVGLNTFSFLTGATSSTSSCCPKIASNSACKRAISLVAASRYASNSSLSLTKAFFSFSIWFLMLSACSATFSSFLVSVWTKSSFNSFRSSNDSTLISANSSLVSSTTSGCSLVSTTSSTTSTCDKAKVY